MFDRRNKTKGFTLLELVLILAMAALLGAMAAPLFVKAHNTNIRIINQANIKAAKAQAERDFESGGFNTKFSTNKKGEQKYFNYYRYNTSTKLIDRLKEIKREDGIALGLKASKQARENKICDYIMLFVGYGDAGKLEIMTAPYYDSDGNVMCIDDYPYGFNYDMYEDRE